MESHEYFDEARWNRTDYIYTFETGSRIEFFSADNSEKVRGPRRNVLFINEANNISYETYTQLAIRTDGDIYLDYNPVASFWVHEEILPKADHDFIILTYKDNEALPQTIVDELESRRDRKGWWDVYGLGQLGDVEGKIYNDWKMVDEVPHTGRLERRGLDFGFTNDPTAIVDVYYQDGGFILDEVLFRKGMSNKQIADTLLNQLAPNTLVVCDSAEPKSIEELKSYGVNAVGIEKTKGDTKDKTWVKWSIDLVAEQRISYTRRSTNIHKGYMNYLWDVDKDGKTLNVPSHLYSDMMDAIRYGIVSIVKKPKVVMQASPLPQGYYQDRDLAF
jgi:phage terminase large subunit